MSENHCSLVKFVMRTWQLSSPSELPEDPEDLEEYDDFLDFLRSRLRSAPGPGLPLPRRESRSFLSAVVETVRRPGRGLGSRCCRPAPGVVVVAVEDNFRSRFPEAFLDVLADVDVLRSFDRSKAVVARPPLLEVDAAASA